MTTLVFIKSYSTDLFWRVYDRATQKEVGFLARENWQYTHWKNEFPVEMKEIEDKVKELSLIYGA